MTDQTIDGVPRALLERLHAEHVSIAGPGFWAAWKELRVLLDAPAENVQWVSVEAFNRVSNELEELKAAQLQVDTVAVVARWSDWSMLTLEIDGQHRTYVDTGKPERPQPAPVAWIRPDVAKTLTKGECCYAFGSQNPQGSLIPLYAYQAQECRTQPIYHAKCED